MARWKLMTSHYVNTIAPVEWEYSAVAGGKSLRKRFIVPRYLDINNPGDWTIHATNGRPVEFGGNDDGANGVIIVCLQDKGQPGDIEIRGDPTPDMMPVDKEASDISAAFTSRWSYRPDDAEISYSQTLVNKFDEVRTAMEEKESTVKIEGLSELMASVVASQKLMADAIAALSHSPRRI